MSLSVSVAAPVSCMDACRAQQAQRDWQGLVGSQQCSEIKSVVNACIASQVQHSECCLCWVQHVPCGEQLADWCIMQTHRA